MSAAARELIPFSFESKNQERLNFWDAYSQCKKNAGDYAPAVVAKKNNTEMLCLIQWTTFLDLLKRASYSSNISVESRPNVSLSDETPMEEPFPADRQARICALVRELNELVNRADPQ